MPVDTDETWRLLLHEATWPIEDKATWHAVIAVVQAAEAYYAFTMKPAPDGFNNDYNQEAIRVGGAMAATLDALPQQTAPAMEPTPHEHDWRHLSGEGRKVCISSGCPNPNADLAPAAGAGQ